MIDIPFRIFPSIAYKNSQFQIVSDLDNLDLLIFEGDNIIHKLNLKKNQLNFLAKLSIPGEYSAKCQINGTEFTQKIVVKDAIRIGSSTLQKVFTFEGIDYSFFLMKDRMLIYDENNNYLLTENHISPTDIIKIDNENLLFVTKIKSRIRTLITNFAIFNINMLKITDELVQNYKRLYFDLYNKRLWLKESSSGKLFNVSKM